ncbi:MAG: DUF302 domain-containing protein [Alphaproteobacteria bacterium]|nr:MAG: DUF302 domain-containing protein [Alphaproteobacteria bacterium]
MLYVKESNKSFDEVCNKIQEASVLNNFGVITVIDLKEKMAAKGVQFGPKCRIIEVCNPLQAKKVLESNMSISAALPCRISVYEEDDKVKIVTLRPTLLLGIFGNPELEPIAKEVEETMFRIIDAAC